MNWLTRQKQKTFDEAWSDLWDCAATIQNMAENNPARTCKDFIELEQWLDEVQGNIAALRNRFTDMMLNYEGYEEELTTEEMKQAQKEERVFARLQEDSI